MWVLHMSTRGAWLCDRTHGHLNSNTSSCQKKRDLSVGTNITAWDLMCRAVCSHPILYKNKCLCIFLVLT
jgi:hypothetical protein